MIFDRKQQRLLLEGKEYTFEDISRLIAGGAEAHSPASWDLYLFLNEWFNDSPVITVHTSGSTGTPKELIVRKERRDGITLYESSLYWCNDGGRAFVGCRLEFDCTSCFRSSFSGYKRAFEICGNGSPASL